MQHAPGGTPLRVLAMLDARMDEIYTSAYQFDGSRWEQLHAYRLQRPEHLVAPAGWAGSDFVLAGNTFASYGARLPFALELPRLTVVPTAAAMLRLAGGLLAQGRGVSPELALPTYIRDKVAQTSLERAAAKATMQTASPPTA